MFLCGQTAATQCMLLVLVPGEWGVGPTVLAPEALPEVLGASRSCSHGESTARSLASIQSMAVASQVPVLGGVRCCHMHHFVCFRCGGGGLTPGSPGVKKKQNNPSLQISIMGMPACVLRAVCGTADKSAASHTAHPCSSGHAHIGGPWTNKCATNPSKSEAGFGCFYLHTKFSNLSLEMLPTEVSWPSGDLSLNPALNPLWMVTYLFWSEDSG